ALYAKVPAIPQDVRIRTGLMESMDLPGLRETILPGFPNTEGYSFMPKSDPRAAAVREPFARYQYDPTQALQELAAGGWRKAANGQIVDQSGAQVAIPLRTTPS